MNIRIILAVLAAFFTILVQSQVVINEFQSSNSSTVVDGFGEYTDWIELYNTSATSVNLEGWSISDDTSLPKKWIFSDINIPAESYMILYASGRDIKVQPSVWDTKIDLGDEWKYIIPTDNITDWYITGFDDSAWDNGKSGFGYGDGDDSTEVPEFTNAIYLRKTFAVDDATTILNAKLHMDYDDGFVAYLNGIEVARRGLSGNPVNYNDYASNHDAVMHLGGSPEEFDITDYKDLFVDGTNLLAVEVHNTGATSSDLTIIPFLSISKTIALGTEYTSTYLNLGTQSSHTNFKLSSSGEPIILSKPDGTVAYQMDSVVSRTNVSYGILSGSAEKAYFLNPTPGFVNSSSGYSLLENDEVSFSHSGGFINGSIALGISSLHSSNIYYTTDGSEPTISSIKYDQAFFVKSTSTIRARIIEDNYLPGVIYSVSFVNGRKPNLPVVSLTTEDANLWDYNTGMYVMGPNAQSGPPNHGANFWNDWEYPFSFVYYNKNGIPQVTQDVGAKIFGGWSRANDQKSFALFARKEYGDNSLDYKFFANNELDGFKSLVLRNSGNDWQRTMFKDGFITTITDHLNIEHQSFQPVVAYLNGEYWGIYNLREKVNEDFLAAHYDLDADQISILQNDADIVEGTNTSYVQLRSYITTNESLAESAKYAYVADRMDVDNYIKYQLANIYVGNTDWPGNNIKYWRSDENPDSKWRWIMYDTDFGFGGFDDVYHNSIAFATYPSSSSWPNPAWSTLLLRRMLTNVGFRNDFINQMADNINTTFTPENVIGHIDSMASIIDSEIPYQVQKWGRSYDEWQWDVEMLREYGEQRPAIMRDHVEDYFDLANQHSITLNISAKNQGRIRVNTIRPSVYPFSGIYFEDVPIELEAVPETGYKFVKWEGSNTTSDRVLNLDLKSSTQLTAVFEELSEEDIELVINEINYNSGDEYNSGDWIELYNPTNATLNLGGFAIGENNLDSAYVIPQGTIVQANGFVVFVKNLDKFKRVYPNVDNVVGEITFGLSSSGEELRIYNSGGTVLDGVDYLPYRPWPDNANGLGYTLELKSPGLNNGIADNWKSDYEGGTPGEANSGTLSEDAAVLPEVTASVDVFPTRFSDYVTIQLNTENVYSNIEVEIINIHGQVVHKVSNLAGSGSFEYNWTPEGKVNTGIYFVKVKFDNQIHNSKIIYLKH